MIWRWFLAPWGLLCSQWVLASSPRVAGGMVDEEDIDRRSLPLQFQAELIPQCLLEICWFDGGDFKSKLLTGCNLPARHTA